MINAVAFGMFLTFTMDNLEKRQYKWAFLTGSLTLVNAFGMYLHIV